MKWEFLRGSAPLFARGDLPGLLLCKTMECPEPPHQVDGVYADDGPVCEEFREYPECGPVAGIVERRYDNARIGDIEIRVARGDT